MAERQFLAAVPFIAANDALSAALGEPYRVSYTDIDPPVAAELRQGLADPRRRLK